MERKIVESVENIFRPNNHSNWLIEYRDVELAVSRKITRLLATHFPHLKTTSGRVWQFKGTEISSQNYQVELVDKTGRVHSILARVHKEFGLEFTGAVLRIGEFLARKSCKVPMVIRNYQGELVTQFAGDLFTVYRFIRGTHYQGNLPELINVASELGRLDTQLLSLGGSDKNPALTKPDAERDWLESFSKEVWEDLLTYAKRRIKQGSDDYFDSLIITYQDYIFEAIDKVQLRENDSPIQLVHSDLHPHNIMSNGRNLLAFIDLDSLRYWERMRAMSFAIHRLVLQHLVNNNIQPADWHRTVKSAEDAFLSAYSVVNPLSRNEATSISYFIRHEALRRATWVTKSFYLKGIEAWKLGIYKQLRSLLEASYFADA